MVTDETPWMHGNLKEYILEHGCYSRDKNLEIYHDWFSKGPRYLFRAVDRKYGISKKVLCDVGCAYGTNLLYCAQGSYGIEIERTRVELARSLGLTIYDRDIMEEDVADLPRAEVVWCSAVLEHVTSPYLFLLKLRGLLEPGGILALYAPTIPIFPALRRIPALDRYLSGYSAREHLYAFVPATLRFVCEKAGFRTIELSPFYPGCLRYLDHISFLNRLTGRIVYIGCKQGKQDG